MAASEIIVKRETRPCYVGDEKAIFHFFAGGYMSPVVAVVEFSDGSVKEVPSESIVFADCSFAEMAWLEKGERWDGRPD